MDHAWRAACLLHMSHHQLQVGVDGEHPICCQHQEHEQAL